MKNMRKWLPWVAGVIYIIVFWLSDRISAAVVQAVGVATIHSHGVLTVVVITGIGVVFSLLFALIVGQSSNRNASTASALALLVAAGSSLVSLIIGIRTFFPRLHTSDLIHNISMLFMSAALFTIILVSGLSELISARRQARMDLLSQ